MSRTGYCMDILARGFFIFVVLDLLLRQWWWALLFTVGLNLVYELTVGRKFWVALRSAPKKPRRNWRVVVRNLWQRAFSRERTKGLVLAGVVLLFMSYFVRLHVYYIVVACLVFTMAAISRFAPPSKSAIMPHESGSDTQVGQTNCPPSESE